MSTNNIAESIFDSISLIVEKRIANLAYDKTVICTVTDVSNAKNNIYTVSDGSVKFNAQGDGGQYQINDQVRVLIIDGDYSKEKFIQGKYSADEDAAPITYVSPFEAVVNITDNLSNSNATIYSIAANDTIKEIPIETISLTNVINENIYDTLSIRAEFQTNFNNLDMRDGDYGIHIKLNIEKQNSEGLTVRDRLDLYFSALRDMVGNPYSYKIYTVQEQTYQFSQWPLGTITSAELYLYQNNNFKYFDNSTGKIETFENDTVDGINFKNIQVKNIYFGFGSEIANIDDNKVEIYTNDALTFTKNNTTDNIQKTISLLWYNKTDNNEYVGFSDGIYDPLYKEQNYINQINYNQRLLAQKSNENIPHDENCLDLSADIEEMVSHTDNLISFIGRDLYAILQGFKRYLTGITWSGVSPFDALLNGSNETSLGVLAQSFQTKINILNTWYTTILKYAKTNIKDNSLSSESALMALHIPFGNKDVENSLIFDLHESIKTLLNTIETQIEGEYKNFINVFESYSARIVDMMNKIDKVATSVYELWKTDNVSRLWAIWNSAPYGAAVEYGDLRNNETFVQNNDNKYCIYWYRYDTECLSIDPILQKEHWEHLTSYDNYGLPILDAEPESGYYDKKPLISNTKGSINPQLRLKTGERFQAVVFYNHIPHYSNILTFSNSVNVEELLKESAGAFYVEHGDKSQESYQSYTEYGTLVNAVDAQITRKLIARFNGETGGDERLIGSTLYWYIPRNNSMISVHQADLSMNGVPILTTLTDSNSIYYKPGYDCYYGIVSQVIDEVDDKISLGVDASTVYFPYHIKEYYQSSATQNTILCQITIGDITYSTEISLSFTSYGTNGTDYTLALLPNPQQPMVTENALLLYTRLFDASGEEILIPSDLNIAAGWCGPTGYLAAPHTDEGVLIGYNISKTSDYYSGIFKCTLQNVEIEGFAQKINLTSYASIPYAYNDQIYMEGPTSIIYDSFGTNPTYYRCAYNLYDSGDHLITQIGDNNDITWTIKYYYNNGSGWTYYTLDIDPNTGERTPKDANGDEFKQESDAEKKIYRGLQVEYVPILTEENTLSVSSMYLSVSENQAIYPVVFATTLNDDNEEQIIWAQPLLILQNKYSSPVINKWDGGLKLDEDNGTILAPMIGAGRKDEDNKFEGILMGDVATKSGDDAISAIGLYGYNAGEQSFGFKVNGTAFLGKAGRGRIVFDGTNGTIESSSYNFGSLTPIGEGAEYDSSKTYCYINNIGNTVEYTYSSATGWENDLKNKQMYIGAGDPVGMKLDLDNGWISIKGEGEEKILLDSATGGKPYFKLGTDDTASLTYDKNGVFDIKYGDKSVFHIDQSGADNAEYYLKTKNYVENISGVRLDLANGELLANTFRLKANDNLLLSNNGSDNYYLQLGTVGTTDTSTSNSLVYNKDGEFILSHGNKPLLKVSNSDYYLQTTDGSIKFDLKNKTFTANNAITIDADPSEDGNYISIGNTNTNFSYSKAGRLKMMIGGTPVIDVASNEYVLKSTNYSTTTGMQINLQTGYIDAYNFKLTSGNFTLSNSHIAPTDNDEINSLDYWYTDTEDNDKGNIIFKTSNDKFAITDTGRFFAQAGKIASWNIGDSYLTAGTFGNTNSFHMYSNNQGVDGTIANYPITEEDITSGVSGWKLTVGDKFGVVSDGTAHCSNIIATGGKIGDLFLSDGKLNNSTNALELSSEGLIIDNIGAKIQVGNFKTYYENGNTYWRTNGPLYIQGTVDDQPITSIELLTDPANQDNRTVEVALQVKSTFAGGMTRVWIKLIDTNGNRLYNDHVNIYYQSGTWAQSSGTDFRGQPVIKKAVGFETWVDIDLGPQKTAIRCGRTEIPDSSWSNGYYVKNIYESNNTGSEGYVNIIPFTLEQIVRNDKIYIIGNIIPKGTGQTLGDKDNAWSAVYTSTGACTTSDINKKNSISSFNNSHDILFNNIKPITYKLNDNSSDRVHYGFIAQWIKDAMDCAGLTTQEFAGYCAWENSNDNSKGCGLRYEEFIPLNTWQIQKLKPRMTEAEERIYKLEQELQELKSKLI